MVEEMKKESKNCKEAMKEEKAVMMNKIEEGKVAMMIKKIEKMRLKKCCSVN